jgi:hypothetical protein
MASAAMRARFIDLSHPTLSFIGIELSNNGKFSNRRSSQIRRVEKWGLA